MLAGFPLTAGLHTVINRQRKKITDCLNLLTQFSELIAWGRIRNTRVWAGPVTRVLVPEVRQSWSTAHIQEIRAQSYLFAPGCTLGRGWQRQRQTNTGLQLKPSITKAQITPWAVLLLWLYCPTCAQGDLPWMMGWARIWGPWAALLFLPHKQPTGRRSVKRPFRFPSQLDGVWGTS